MCVRATRTWRSCTRSNDRAVRDYSLLHRGWSKTIDFFWNYINLQASKLEIYWRYIGLDHTWYQFSQEFTGQQGRRLIWRRCKYIELHPRVTSLIKQDIVIFAYYCESNSCKFLFRIIPERECSRVSCVQKCLNINIDIWWSDAVTFSFKFLFKKCIFVRMVNSMVQSTLYYEKTRKS